MSGVRCEEMHSAAGRGRAALLLRGDTDVEGGARAQGADIRPRRANGGFRRLLAFIGPGYLVAVGYMDPGNWAAAVSAGSAFGYRLLSVVLACSVMAMVLQAAAARLGLAADMDLARACRLHFGRRTNLLLWLVCELAIIACNITEVLGMACGLQLVLHIPLTWGVCLTALDVLLVLQLQRRRFGYLETVIIGLTALIVGCLVLQLWWLKPSVEFLTGFIPGPDLLKRPDMLYVAIAILGATVMPHNLYLHSAIVRVRRPERERLDRAIRYATIDSNVALSLALLVNVAILVLAAGAFHRRGIAPIDELADAYHLLTPLLGSSAASTVFGLALIASGLSSSITGTLAGQVVMDGFLELPVSRGTRALISRAVAIAPALAVAAMTDGGSIGRVLVLTQVILGLQLPFAVVPLLWFTTRRRYLGPYAFGKFSATILWTIAALVVGGNLWWIVSTLS